jgi:hypothetical protein
VGLIRSLLFALSLLVFVLLAFVANVGYWAIATALDTDRFVATTARVFDDPTVRTALSEQLATGIAEGIAREDGSIPPAALDALGVPPGASRGEVETALAVLLGDLMTQPVFVSIRDDTVRGFHETLLGAMRGSGALAITGGALTLDLDQLVDELDRRLDPDRPGLFGQPIPDGIGVVVLFDAPWLEDVGRIFQALDVAQWALPALAVVCGLLVLLFARHRVQALAWLGVGLVLVGGLSIALVTIGAPAAAIVIGSPGDTVAVLTAMLRDLGDALVRQSALLIGLGVVLLIVGLVGDSLRGRGEPRMDFA